MKKLVFFVNVDWFFVSHRLPIALTALNEGYSVHLICKVTNKKEILESYGIHVHDISLSRSGYNIFQEFITLVKCFFVIKKIAPDIIHSVTIKPVIYGNIISRILSVPVRVSSISGLGYLFISNKFSTKLARIFVSKLYRLALSGAFKIIFQNRSDLATIRDLGAIEEKQELIIRGSGVNLSEFCPSEEPKGRPVVLFSGRLLKDKGVLEFIDAAITLKSLAPEIRMVLVGDIDEGNPNSITHKQLSVWCSEGYVEHWGYSDDMPSVLSKSNLVVLPSYREGLPKSLIEAAASKRAVITTDVPGCRDAITPNKTGILIPVRNSKKLASAILDLVKDDENRKALARCGRKLAEREFDINKVIEQHMAIYSKEAE